MHYGKGKSGLCSDFLADFVNEVVSWINFGFDSNGKLLKDTIKAFICDAPAKAFILGIKGHTGHSSCTRCNQVETWHNNWMTFPSFDGFPRTQESFLLKEDEEFHIYSSAITFMLYVFGSCVPFYILG